MEDASISALEDTDTHPFLYYSDGDADVSEDVEEMERGEGEGGREVEREDEKKNVDGVKEKGEVREEEGEGEGEEIREIEGGGVREGERKEEGEVGIFADVLKRRVFHFAVPSTSHASVTRDPQTIHLAMQFIEAIQVSLKVI